MTIIPDSIQLFPGPMRGALPMDWHQPGCTHKNDLEQIQKTAEAVLKHPSFIQAVDALRIDTGNWGEMEIRIVICSDEIILLDNGKTVSEANIGEAVINQANRVWEAHRGSCLSKPAQRVTPLDARRVSPVPSCDSDEDGVYSDAGVSTPRSTPRNPSARQRRRSAQPPSMPSPGRPIRSRSSSITPVPSSDSEDAMGTPSPVPARLRHAQRDMTALSMQHQEHLRLVSQVGRQNAQIQGLESDLQRAENQIARKDTQIDALQHQLQELSAQYDETQDDFQQQIAAIKSNLDAALADKAAELEDAHRYIATLTSRLDTEATANEQHASDLQDTIASQHAEIEELRQRILGLQAQHQTELAETVVDFESLDAYANKVAQLNDDLAKKNASLQELLQFVSSKESEACSRLQQKCDALSAQAEEIAHLKSANQQWEDHHNATFAIIYAKLEQALVEKRALQEHVDAQSGLLENTRRLLQRQAAKEQAATIQTLTEQLAALKQQKQETNDKLQVAQTALAASQAGLAQAEEKTKQLAAISTELTEKLAAEQAAFAKTQADAETSMNALKAECDRLGNNTRVLELQLKQVQSEQTDLGAKKSETEQALQAQLATLKGNQESTVAAFSAMQAHMASLQEAKATADKHADASDAAVLEANIARAALETQLLEQKAAVREATALVDTVNASLEQATAKKQDLEAKIIQQAEATQKNQADLNDQIAVLQIQLGEAQDKIRTTEATIAQQNQTIEQLGREKDALTAQVKTATKRAADLQQELEALTETSQTQEGTITELRTLLLAANAELLRLQSIETTVATHESALLTLKAQHAAENEAHAIATAALNKQLSQAQAASTENKAQLAAKETELADLKAKIKALEAKSRQSTSLHDDLKAKATEITLLAQQVERTQRALEAEQEQVAAANRTKDAYVQSNQTLEAELTALKAQVTGLTQELHTVNNMLGLARGTVEALQSGHAEDAKQIAALETKIRELEAEIENLKAQLKERASAGSLAERVRKLKIGKLSPEQRRNALALKEVMDFSVENMKITSQRGETFTLSRSQNGSNLTHAVNPDILTLTRTVDGKTEKFQVKDGKVSGPNQQKLDSIFAKTIQDIYSDIKKQLNTKSISYQNWETLFGRQHIKANNLADALTAELPDTLKKLRVAEFLIQLLITDDIIKAEEDPGQDLGPYTVETTSKNLSKLQKYVRELRAAVNDLFSLLEEPSATPQGAEGKKPAED